MTWGWVSFTFYVLCLEVWRVRHSVLCERCCTV
jgi:hypothetical protein